MEMVVFSRFHVTIYLLFCKFTLHVTDVYHTHHQEHTKLQLQPPILVQLPPSVVKLVAILEGGSCTKNMTRTGDCL